LRAVWRERYRDMGGKGAGGGWVGRSMVQRLSFGALRPVRNGGEDKEVWTETVVLVKVQWPLGRMRAETENRLW
jgi:hypothetical protein